MIRVCHIVRQFAPSVGGLESFVASLAVALQPHGFYSDVLTLDRVFAAPGERLPKEQVIDGVTVRRIPMIGHRRFFTPVMHDSLLRDYDILHVHGVDGMFERIARAPPLAGQVRVATSHGVFFHTPFLRHLKKAYFGSVTRMAAIAYDAFIANSASDAALMRRVSRGRIERIPNGVAPLGPFRAAGADLLFVGRLASHKHVDRLVALMAEPPLGDVTLHVVGPASDVSERSLAEKVQALGLAGRVHIHGHLPSSRLAEIARTCGVFVSASTYEGFGMSLLEAMAIGLTPVVEQNASFTELLSDAPVGRLTSFERPSEAAAAVAAARDQVTDVQRDAAMRYAARFSWEAHAERTAALYMQLSRQRAAA